MVNHRLGDVNNIGAAIEASFANLNPALHDLGQAPGLSHPHNTHESSIVITSFRQQILTVVNDGADPRTVDILSIGTVIDEVLDFLKATDTLEIVRGFNVINDV